MAALAALRPKHERRAPKKFNETSSSEVTLKELHTKTHLRAKLTRQKTHLRGLHHSVQSA